jgi:cysteinyl-tRNA synthetase
MATIKLYNSLTKKIQDFTPLKSDEVTIYTCGPTVYNTPHIGNYRAYIFADILRRTLESSGYAVKQVINLTDVDDKTIKKSIELGISLAELTHQYEQEFYTGRKELNLLDAYKYPRATDSINEMVEIIKTLLEKGYAYKDTDGSIYFRVEEDKEYGKLVNIDKDKLKQNASGRMSSDEYDNDSVQDFALWKAWDADDGEVFWDTDLGRGRPGWHIECSAMAKEFLGETIDIHTGGVDNMFPHHENEIAQSECAHGKVFSNYFLHCEHLLVDGKKMAKRDGNFLMLTDLVQNGVSPLSYKYFLYGTHYRTQANLTWEGLFAAETSLMRMYEKFISIMHVNVGTVDFTYVDKVKSSLQNDLNTAESLATFIALFDDTNISAENKLSTILEIDKILGFGFNEYYKLDKTLPADVQTIADERLNARSLKDYTRSDELRELLNQRGYVVIDTKDSSIVVPNPLK